MKTLKLVERKGNRWQAVSVSHTGTHSNAAIKKYHKQFLAKALESLETDPFERRSFASTIIALDPALFPYARKRIEKFCRDLNEELQLATAPTEVYKLMVQFFPVTRISTRRRESRT